MRFFTLGSLGKKGGRRCHLLFNKRWHLLPFCSVQRTPPPALDRRKAAMQPSSPFNLRYSREKEKGVRGAAEINDTEISH
jgi:hypothetical protein